MSDVAKDILAGLDALRASFGQQFRSASSELGLRGARADFLGKKGELTRLLKAMAAAPAEARRELGQAVNELKGEVEQAFNTRLAELEAAARKAELEATPYDLSLPGRYPLERGHQHPITQAQDQILDIFRNLGFQVAWGPEVETEENNFTRLAFPPDHPATDMQDTFWVDVKDARAPVPTVLRTHTSNVQSRYLATHEPPMAIVSAGRVYRRDDDVTHSPMFHQVEGFIVDQGIAFADLKGVLTSFAEQLYGVGTPVRFRPSYFPFVEPGAELDVGCVFCRPEDGSREHCRVCKSTGWLEILGCGMIHPRVLAAGGIDAERFSGFAFGMGVERQAMLRHGIPDIRLLFENDPRFLAQF